MLVTSTKQEGFPKREGLFGGETPATNNLEGGILRGRGGGKEKSVERQEPSCEK